MKTTKIATGLFAFVFHSSLVAEKSNLWIDLERQSELMRMGETRVHQVHVAGEFVAKGRTVPYSFDIRLKNVSDTQIKSEVSSPITLAPGDNTVIEMIQADVWDKKFNVKSTKLWRMCNPEVPDTLSVYCFDGDRAVLNISGPKGAEGYHCQVQCSSDGTSVVLLKPWSGKTGFRNPEVLLEQPAQP